MATKSIYVGAKSTLRQQVFSPLDGDTTAEYPAAARLHSAVPISHIIEALGNYDNPVNESVTGKHVLDGFLLLEAAGMGFPDDVRQVNLSDQRLTKIAEDDMLFFTELEFLDVSENNLNMSQLFALPNLTELRIACNGISDFTFSRGFNELSILDLSYNKLCFPHVIQKLDNIEYLKELDLSGNGLKSLPMEMFRFKYLEKLILDHNKIDDNFVFQILAAVPKLRYISMASNYLSVVPPKSCKENCFRLLEVLDISSNYFIQDDHLVPLIDLARLTTLLLYGNPILGPTGEDPSKIYIEDLVEASLRGREGSSRKYLDIVTDAPRKKISLRTIVGRQATYRNIRLAKVDKDANEKSQREWRQIGNQSLFGEAVAALRKQLPSIPTGSAPQQLQLADNTFLTSAMDMYSEVAHVSSVDRIAEDVMNRVAREMDISNSGEFLSLQKRVTLKTPMIDRDSDLAAIEQKVASVFHRDSGSGGTGKRRDDQVPQQLFVRDMAASNALPAAQSMELKTAIKALKFALEHPLTDDSEVPQKGILGLKSYVRPTQCYHNRKVTLPISRVQVVAAREYSKLGFSGKQSTEAFAASFPHPQSSAMEKSLLQIDEVLEGLNKNTDSLVAKKCGHGRNVKESVGALAAFARPPNAKIKSLVSMINEVID